MARKTIRTAEVIALANARLAANVRLDDMSPERAFREGVASLLERILFTNDAYAGFSYLDGPEGDQTRRLYYVSHKLNG